MTLAAAQKKILARVKKYPKGIKVDAMQGRTARTLKRLGLIEYDDYTGIVKEKAK